MLFIVVVGNALHQIISMPIIAEMRKNAMPSVYRRRLGVSVFSVLLVMVTLIAFGSLNLARHITSNGSRYIPEETMDAYRWIDCNLPNKAEVATLDWEDITLLPIFTNVNLVVGHSIIDGRKSSDELKRFINIWKFLGYNRLQFEQMIELGTASTSILFQVTSRINPPCLPKEQFEASQFMMGILYWPHVNKIGNITIAEGGVKGKITPEFRLFVMNLYDSTMDPDVIRKYKIQYIIMSSKQVALLGNPKGMKLLYKTKTRSIFSLPTLQVMKTFNKPC